MAFGLQLRDPSGTIIFDNSTYRTGVIFGVQSLTASGSLFDARILNDGYSTYFAIPLNIGRDSGGARIFAVQTGVTFGGGGGSVLITMQGESSPTDRTVGSPPSVVPIYLVFGRVF